MSNEKDTCTRCGGSGRISCPACGGAGTKEELNEDFGRKERKIVSCAACHGSGIRTCGVCGGSGNR
jgi:DnaJ-class molecular chaperone